MRRICADLRFLWLAGALLALAWTAPTAYADEETDACMRCHGDAAELKKSLQDPKKGIEGLLVDLSVYARSVHMDVGCVDCHDGFDEHPHATEAETYSCAECHEEAVDVFAKSIHGQAKEGVDNLPAACTACHGGAHVIFQAEERESLLHPLNIYKACGSCHFESDPSTASVKVLLHEKLTDDAHARGILKGGLIHSATCVVCHGGHEITAVDDPESRVGRERINEVCGSCHLGVQEQWRKSVHFLQPNRSEEDAGKQKGATCTDCHKPHGITKADTHFKLEIIETCSECHEDQGRTFKGTYHGRISKIGFGGVASCDECHTAHSIQPSSEPSSTLHADNRTATCAECHEGATDSFAAYLVHADPLDRENFPILYWARRLMRGMIFFTWAIWGLHTLMWLFRALRERKHLRAAVKPVSGRWYRRWPWYYRAIHLTLVFSFLTLAVTGIPLRFPDAGWAKVFFDILGGPESARFLHRVGAFMTFAYTAFFLGMIFWRRIRGERGLFWGPNTLLPQYQDLKDMKANIRWFIKGGEAPGFDRWTYWEKFDFIAEAWGVFFIGITGLVMWFPMFFTSFLPGSVINLAHILHSYEALLATTFIFSMHFFNANLRPGKFPIDPLFLTGRISEEELKHERPREYERMLASGRLQSEALPPPNKRLVRRAYKLGGLMLSIGLLLLGLMLYAMFQYGLD